MDDVDDDILLGGRHLVVGGKTAATGENVGADIGSGSGNGNIGAGLIPANRGFCRISFMEEPFRLSLHRLSRGMYKTKQPEALRIQMEESK